jgi:hypothetical protein
MRRWGIIFILIIGIFTLCAFGIASDNESLKIHPFTQSTAYCSNCHLKNDKKIINTKIICSQLCLTCHNEMENHHIINVKIVGKLQEDFNLTEKKRLTCISCHSLNSTRFDNSSWKAQSLYEKAFTGKSQYKTYYLIKKNNDGQLCKTCH